MLHFYKFSDDVYAPVPGREIYEKGRQGKGWPEECPPLRAANAFGWVIPASFDMTFRQADGAWRIENPCDLESDWLYSRGEEGGGEGIPLVQRNAWFWDEGQELPHRISDGVYPHIRNQVKVSTYLFMYTDPNELIYLCDLPNRRRPYRAVSVVLDTDWYPASYPWHCVLELDNSREEIRIEKGEPICRLFLVRRDSYFAREMSTAEFEGFFERAQEWLSRHGRGDATDMLDITKTYVKHQRKAAFTVIL